MPHIAGAETREGGEVHSRCEVFVGMKARAMAHLNTVRAAGKGEHRLLGL